MAGAKRDIPRGKMSAEERAFRSALKKLIASRGMLRGTIVRRERVCGRPNCRCARGEKHPEMLLVVSEDGKRRQLHIAKEWHETVEQWVSEYHEVRELLEELSRLHWEKVTRREL